MVLLYLAESDFVSGTNLFKQKIAKLFQAVSKSGSHIKIVVACYRTSLNSADFLRVQNFVLIEFNLSLIPVSHINCLVQLLQQFGSVDKKQNPYKYGIQNSESRKGGKAAAPEQLVKILAKIPLVGEKSANSLLQKFQTLPRISQATEEELVSVIGKSSGRNVFNYFNN